MPRYSEVTFKVQPVERQGTLSGYVVDGYMSKEQVVELRRLVDSADYQREGSFCTVDEFLTSAVFWFVFAHG